MKRYNKFIFILFVTAILSGIATSLEAQDKPKKKKTALIEVKGLVTDNTGKPLSGVTVLSGEGSIINYTDANGKFALKTKADGTLLIEAFGYKDVVINLTCRRWKNVSAGPGRYSIQVIYGKCIKIP